MMSEPVTPLMLSGKALGGADTLAHISLVDGKNNSYIGLSSGASRPLAGGNNTYVGGFSGANATADATVLVGMRAGRVAKAVREAVFIGYRAGEFASRVESSVCVGPYSGQKMKRANMNCMVGYAAGAELTSGSRNCALGAYASFQQYSGTDNVCVGYRSGYRNRIGANNCYIGSNSGFSAVSGYENACLGVGSGQFLTSGTKNVLCGFLAGNAISNASNCIAIGTRAMEFFFSGDTNTCLGTETARRLTGNNNTILGGYTASNASGSFNTVVGSRSMNRTNNWRVDLQNSVILGENVQFNLPVNVIGLTYENATAYVVSSATTGVANPDSTESQVSPAAATDTGIVSGALDVIQKIAPADRATNDNYGQSVAVSADGNYIVVGAPRANAVPVGYGAAYVYVKSGTWQLQQKVALPGALNERAGYKIAISSDGSYFAVGSLGSTNADSAGAVYIYVRSGSAWALQATVVVAGGVAGGLFGYSGVDISGSGDALIAGAPHPMTGTQNYPPAALTANTTTLSGQAYGNGTYVANCSTGSSPYSLFDGEATNYGWGSGTRYATTTGVALFTTATVDGVGVAGEWADIRLPAPIVLGSYAIGVAPSTLIVTSARPRSFVIAASSDGITWTHVDTRTGQTYADNVLKQFSLSNAVTPYRYYRIIVTSTAGATEVFFTLWRLSAQGTGGAAYVYTRASSTWSLAQQIVSTDRAVSDEFGISSSISSDGTIALVGAHAQTTNAAGGAPLTNAGAAYVFTKSSGVWTQTQKLVASDRTAEDRFGYAVSLAGNGLYAIVGAWKNTTNASGGSALSGAGAVYIFSRAIGGSVWTQAAKVVAFDRASNDFFGYDVTISGDAQYALVGSYGNDTNATGGAPLATAGAVYFLAREGSSWTAQRKLVASDRTAGDEFGQGALGISDNGAVVAVGARVQDTFGGTVLTDAGASYVYYNSNVTASLVDITLDSGLVSTEDISYFMNNPLVSPILTPSVGLEHRTSIAFEIDTAPTLDTLAPYERYLAFGSSESTAAWAKNLKPAPLTIRVGTTGDSTPNPPNGLYRLRWNHNAFRDASRFKGAIYQHPSRYDLYVEPGPSNGVRAITHTIDGQLVAINGTALSMVSAVGDGRSLADGGTIVTITTTAPHGLASDTVIALGSIANPVLTAGITGIWTLTSTTSTTMTCTTNGDGITTIALGSAELYTCPRFVSTNAHTVFIRLQIDGRPAIAFTIPKPLNYGFLDIIVEQTNEVYGASAELNLKVRHAAVPSGVSYIAKTPPVGYFDVIEYTTFTVPGNLYTEATDESVCHRTFPGSYFEVDSTSITVINNIATFSTQIVLADPETEAELYDAWRADFPDGGAPYTSAAYSRWLNHRLLVCGGEIYIENSTTSYFNGAWKVKDILGQYSFTIDMSALQLKNGDYPIGVRCHVYPARVFFNRVTDGVRFFRDTDDVVAYAKNRIQPHLITNPRRIYMRAARGHDLSVGSTVFFAGADDERLNGCFTIVDCPELDTFWDLSEGFDDTLYVTGYGRDTWAAFDVDFDFEDPIETLTGPNIVQYVARLDASVQHATLDGFTNDPPGSLNSTMKIRTANTVNIVSYASKSDLEVYSANITGPTLDDGHVHLGFGSQLQMNANIEAGQLEFTDLGPSRAVYTIGDFNTTLLVQGTWSLAPNTMNFGVDWLDEYGVRCVKSGDIFDLFATRVSGTEIIQVAQISHSAVVLGGSVVGESLPLQISDITSTQVPRLTLAFTHNFKTRTLDIDLVFQGGSIVDNVYTQSVSHATRISFIPNYTATVDGATLYAPGDTVEFFSDGFTTLANVSIKASRIRESPKFANVVYLGSSHAVSAEEDRQDVLIASLGPNRLIRANVDTFRIYSSTLAVGNISCSNGASTFGSVARVTQSKSGAAGFVTHDYAISSVFYHSIPTANFTCAVSNVPTTNDRSLPLTLVIAQSGTPYMVDAIQINNLQATILWLNNVVPTGTASKTNLVTFEMYRTADAWTVLGKSEVFG